MDAEWIPGVSTERVRSRLFNLASIDLMQADGVWLNRETTGELLRTHGRYFRDA